MGKGTLYNDPARYNSSALTLTDGDSLALQTDSAGNLKVSLATRIAGEDITNDVLKTEQRYSYVAINSATTTLVKSGAGFLHCIAITGGTLGGMTIYDNTSATGTAIVNTSTVSASGTLFFDGSFNTGLTIVTATAMCLTVSYR